jgi:uncharacterized protein with PQ loop repeat
VVKTYKTKSTKDFSPTFLFMRVIGTSIWLAYSIELQQFLFMIANVVSLFSSIFISYYKVVELYQDYVSNKDIKLYNKLDENLSEDDKAAL